jgi:uncharacterized protein (TIGR03083 family)
MEVPGIIETANLYAPLDEQLIRLLEGLTPEDWRKPTVCHSWSVRDIAAHLLHGDIRRLSFARDQLETPPTDLPIASYAGLVSFINRLNEDFVGVARLLSTRLLIDFLRLTGPQVSAHLATLDMMAPSRFSVAWAGEEVSCNWFGVARDYTERWHHQEQIRDGVGAPPLTSAYWLSPVLETFMRALPHTYRNVEGAEGAAVVIHIEGEAGGLWTLVRTAGNWRLFNGEQQNAATRIALDQDTAWRHFTKGLPTGEATRRIHIAGDERLGQPYLGSLAVMA